mgnify:CR=1 FL=1
MLQFHYAIMHAELQKLLELQETDREIARVNQEIAALPRRVAEIESKLASVNAQVEKARAALKQNEKTRRKYEGDIQSLQQKISKYRDQMLSVKTNQEYKALGEEITFAEKEIRGLEDKILDGMVEAEGLEKQIKAAEAEQRGQKAEVEKEKAEARTRTDEDKQRLGELKPRQEALRREINADLLRHYDRVLKLRGSALSEASDQKCLACNVMLRPQVYNDVRADQQVLTCDSCGRILYYDPAHHPQPEVPASRPAQVEEEVTEPAEVPDHS